ncbi:MAG: MFS transporter [Anaerolineales bacterium]|nr:MFS transporter [Anaerolineales bacterium]
MSRDLILIAFSLLTWGFGEGMFFYFQPLYLQQLGANPMMIGTILGGVGAAMTVVHLPAGYLADRVGRRPLLHAAWCMGVLATLVMALAPSLPLYTLGSILYGLTAFVSGPLSSYITTARGKWSVGRALTLVSAFFSAGGILGPLVGGWIGENLGLRRTFLIAALFFIVSTVILFFIRSQPVESATPEQRSAGLRKVIGRRFFRYLGVVFFAMFVMYLPQPLSQNYLQNERGVNLISIGQLAAMLGLGVVFFNLVLGQLPVRLGFRVTMITMSLFTLLVWWGSSFTWYMLGYFCMGSYRTARSFAIAQGRGFVDQANMGFAYGSIETVASMAVILAPPLAGWLYTHTPNWIYSLSLPLIGLALLVTIFFTPHPVEEPRVIVEREGTQTTPSRI